ncbi:hypothetical protein FOH38_23675 [Lysinibacillus fusiformis]|nr:hypothetical protein FOH38_23675 [Lysinibacillus fusiformis]
MINEITVDEIVNQELKDLEFKIIEEADKVLFREVISCYESKAYRAAFIINWLMIVESLKAKFEEIANTDSNIKKNVIDKLRDFESKNNATDKFLIEEAKNYGWIDKEETLKLHHMYKLRGAYAHPLKLAPKDYEVKCAIKQGVDLILSKPTLLRHNFVDNLTNDIFNVYHFIEDDVVEIQKLAQQYLAKIDPSIYSYFFKQIIKRMNTVHDDRTKEKFIIRGREFLGVLLGDHYNFNLEDTWKVKNQINTGNILLANLITSADIWSKMPEDIKSVSFNNLIEPMFQGKIEKPSFSSIYHIYNLKIKGLLNEKQLAKLIPIVDSYQSRAKKNIGVSIHEYIKDVISELSSMNWYDQNYAIKTVMEIENLGELDKDILIELGRNILQAADGKSDGAQEFINRLNKDTINDWPISLIEGLFLETIVNEKSFQRFKIFSSELLVLITNLNLEDFDEILGQSLLLLPKEINYNSTRFDYPVTEKYLETLEKIEETHSHSENIKQYKNYFLNVRNFLDAKFYQQSGG